MSEETSQHYLEVIAEQDRVPHAQGWIGYSMESLEQKAIDLACRLFAKAGAEHHADKLQAKMHPDFLIFEPASKSGQYTIEQIRQISDKSQLYPHEASAQFFILRYGERMPIAASNAFLKTLEEPAPNTYFILLIEHIEELISTLKSRLQILSFDKERPFQTTERSEALNAFLKKWPRFTYEELFETGQTLQVSLDALNVQEPKEIISFQHEIESLFTQIEVWYSHHKEQLPFSFRAFRKHFEKARLGCLRSMKFNLALEYLFLSLKQKR